TEILSAAGARVDRLPDEQLVEDLRHGANAGWSRELALSVHRELVATTRAFFGTTTIKDRGQRSGPFWVLLDSEIPSILVELGYLTEAKEEQRIRSHAFQEQAAEAIASGVAAWVERAEEAEKGRPE
ncbi:MAG: N-acetylmuramoyl-L-alanine amidase, partial [Deltaproteobacteria bacterium]|nr:N-acetylmuramoyl-L-alanine amidase [Deltaproteobacteria bacterium]